MINEANETPAAEIPELNTETIETIGISSNDGNYFCLNTIQGMVSNIYFGRCASYWPMIYFARPKLIFIQVLN